MSAGEDRSLLAAEDAAFDRLEGRASRPLAALSAAWRRGRLAQSLLFAGPRGSGKRHAAVRLAQLLACARVSAEGLPCLSCAACQRTSRGVDPDMVVLEPAFDERRKVQREEISIEQVRTLQAGLELRSSGVRRAVLVDPADRLSLVAQEAMLKTLEEPPPGVTLVLVTCRPSVLKPTVRSRCQLVRFAPLEAAAVSDLLRGLGRPEHEAALAAALCGGDLRRAQQVDAGASGERWITLARSLYEVLGAQGESKARDLAVKLAPKKGSEEAEGEAGEDDPITEWLVLMERILRDTMLAGTLAPSELEGRLTHPDGLKAAQALATRLPPEAAARCLAEVARAREDLGQHVRARVVLTSLFLTLHELGSGDRPDGRSRGAGEQALTTR